MPHKRSKGSALYLHAVGGRYDCQDCAMFLKDSQRCTIHGPGDIIRAIASCGYFMPGPPIGIEPKGYITKAESGYTEDVHGASCKRCEYFNPEGDCLLVDKDSPGDDPGTIDPNGCCCLWEEPD